MRRLLSSVLIITVFAMQSISFSHVHLPCGQEEAGHHSGRPHFHVHGGHSHAAHHKKSQHEHVDHECAATVHASHHMDHDLDACYLPDSLASNLGLMQIGAQRLLTACTLDFVPERFVLHASVPQQYVRQFPACSRSTARVPLYLRSLAILC
jgi:hypothetical protein